jgi:hypothetical protein
MPLTKASAYRAYAAASLANAEAAVDRKSRDVHLAIAEHFYLLAEDEIIRVDTKNGSGDVSFGENAVAAERHITWPQTPPSSRWHAEERREIT